ncbi:MAG: penicillin-binding protein [Patescibacteria group bacterium]|nr:penicillin-binding protein [Patescibacteria group bacterium]MDE1945756.1 penicillin-binding protein [Patescibacteria group bacterium]
MKKPHIDHIVHAVRHDIKHNKKGILLGMLAVVLALFGMLALWMATFKLPDLSSLSSVKVAQSTRIYDRTGTILLYEIHQDQNRTVVPFSAISDYIKNATIAIEDPTFYEHGAIKVTSIIRSLLVDIFSGSFSQGGSTITQQVVKNSVLTNEKSISRKLKELVLSLELERAMSKDDILALYLNGNPYGGNTYGVEEASQKFFGTSSASVDLAEAAYVAAIANAPTFYSPYGPNRAALDARKNLVLDKMLENKFITQEQHDAAVKEKVNFLPPSPTGIQAPHFVEFIKQYLVNKYGEDMVSSGGLKVITTLDASLQSEMETIIANYAPTLQTNFNASNAAAVAIDPKTGGILAMVGSENYFSTTTDGQYNVALALRQPGSTFKPFIYATAFEKGYTPDTILFDLPTEFQTTCTPQGQPIDPNAPVSSSTACYMPSDFDGLYRGPVSLRSALALSLNIPSVQLFYLAGQKDSLDTAKAMGITSLSDDPNQYGLTLVLGGGEVSLLDMTSAYGVFANEGVRNPYTGIISVTDATGDTLEQYATSGRQVLPQNIADLMNDVLSDNVAKAPEYGSANSVFMFPGREVAAKTGTTNDYRDVWSIGYTPDVVVGTWAGNNDNTPMVKNIAGLIVAPLWRQLMAAALASTSVDDFIKPLPEDPTLKPVLRGIWQGDDTYFIDTVSGKLATDLTPPETKKEVAVPNIHSILYWVDKSDPTGPAPVDPTVDSQYNLWEYPIQQWLLTHPQPATAKPIEYDDVHTAANRPTVMVASPLPGKTYGENDRIPVSFAVSAKYPVASVNFSVNEELVGTSDTPPYFFSFVPSSMNIATGTSQLTISVYDSVYNEGDVTVPVTIGD